MDEIKIDKVIRSHRKTIALVITQDTELFLHAPIHTPLEYIRNLVDKKRFWINRKQEEIRKRPIVNPKKFVNRESFFFLKGAFFIPCYQRFLCHWQSGSRNPQSILQLNVG